MNVASLLPSMYKHPPHFSCNQTGFSPHMRAKKVTTAISPQRMEAAAIRRRHPL
jgi:hypothetical protein